MSSFSFEKLPLRTALLKNLLSLGYRTMTPIQSESLPLILMGKDVIAQAKTGSGKTAAYGLGVLNRLDVKQFRIQTLILCPTRELADQVAHELRQLARAVHNIKILTLCGGVPLRSQMLSLEHGAHIIVGTPGRIDDHIRKGTLDLSHVDGLVLDEADRMMDMGFQDVLEKIIKPIKKQRQTLLFSATFPKKIQSMAQRMMQKPEMVKVESIHDDKTIEQHFFKVENQEQRINGLLGLLLKYHSTSTLIFCNTKKETQRVAHYLSDQGMSVVALHGDLEQYDRDETLIRFSNKSVSILVATDVAARGLDIDEIELVINYEVAHDPEVHVHRIGRTGRAGEQGIACTLFDEAEAYKIALMGDFLQEVEPLPSLVLLKETHIFSSMISLKINAGKKQKIRPGDILGALTGDHGIAAKSVGKINILPTRSYVAVDRKVLKLAKTKLAHDKLKGRSVKVAVLGH